MNCEWWQHKDHTEESEDARKFAVFISIFFFCWVHHWHMVSVVLSYRVLSDSFVQVVHRHSHRNRYTQNLYVCKVENDRSIDEMCVFFCFFILSSRVFLFVNTSSIQQSILWCDGTRYPKQTQDFLVLIRIGSVAPNLHLNCYWWARKKKRSNSFFFFCVHSTFIRFVIFVNFVKLFWFFI